jgi:predicted secreted protein
MKKIILSILCFSIIVISTGCKNENNIKETPNDDYTLKVSLYSNPSTGYGWKYDIDNKDIITVSVAYDNSGCPEDVDGCGGNEVFTVRGLKQGKAIINLRYCFLDTEECGADATYEFTVNEDLSISEIHYGTYFN